MSKPSVSGVAEQSEPAQALTGSGSTPSEPARPSGEVLRVEQEAPWLGLKPFSEEVQSYFFGRETELAELFQRVASRNLAVLYGQSGLGKTSLLQAALIPRLRAAGFAPALLRLKHEEQAPPLAEQLISAMRDALPGIHMPTPPTLAGEQTPCLWLLLHDPQYQLCQPGRRVIVIFDQFEEIFTLGQSAERAEASRQFLETLAALVENRAPSGISALLESDQVLADRLDFSARSCSWLIALREDYLHQLERWRRAMPSLMDNRMELRVLNGVQAFQATVEPGKLRTRNGSGLPPIIDDDAGRAIVRFVAGVGDDVKLEEIQAVPPLLSLLCAELNLRRRQAKALQIRSDHLRGSAGDILADFYERCFEGQHEALRVFVEQRLLSPEGFRQSANLDAFLLELTRSGLTRVQAERSVKHLVDNRLLVGEERGGIKRLELTHDILTKLVRSSRERREAEERRQSEARQEQARQEQRRKRQIFWALVVAASAALCAAVAVPLLLKARREFRRAEASLAEATAANARTGHLLDQAASADVVSAFGNVNQPAAALAYLARALSYRDSVAAAADYGAALLSERPNADVSAVFVSPSAVTVAEFSHDGQRALSVSEDHQVRVWDVESSALLATLVGHTAAIYSAAFSPDGSRILTGSWDQSARLWDAASGKELLKFLGHGDHVQNATFNADGSRVVTASLDNTARLWDAGNGVQLAVFHHDSSVFQALFSPDGSRVFTTSEDKSARLWDVASGKQLGRLSHGSPVLDAVFSRDGTRVLTSARDKRARLWDVSSKKQIATFDGHIAGLVAIALNADASRVLTASNDQSVRVWDARSGKQLHDLTRYQAEVTSAVFSPDATRILTAAKDGSLRLWDAESGRQQALLRAHNSAVYNALFNDNGSHIISASEDHTARVFAVASSRQSVLDGHERRLSMATFNRAGTRALTASFDHSARIWDVANGKQLVVLTGHTAELSSALFSPDGKHVLTASEDHSARLWDVASGKELRSFTGHSAGLARALFSPDGTRVLTASGDNSARLWDCESGKALSVLEGHSAPLSAAAFNASGLQVVSASLDGSARVWDARSGKTLVTFSGHSAALNGATFSPDGTRVVTASDDRTARVWDVNSGQQIALFSSHLSTVNSAAFSPDGLRVLTASGDQSARIWDAATGAQTALLARHSGPVTGAIFSPDGATVLTFSSDFSARLWDAAQGTQLAVFSGHVNVIAGAEFSADGSLVITASHDNQARIWRVLGPARGNLPEWFPDLLRVAGNSTFTQNGELALLAGSDWTRIQGSLLRAVESDTTRYGALARWYLGRAP